MPPSAIRFRLMPLSLALMGGAVTVVRVAEGANDTAIGAFGLHRRAKGGRSEMPWIYDKQMWREMNVEIKYGDCMVRI